MIQRYQARAQQYFIDTYIESDEKELSLQQIKKKIQDQVSRRMDFLGKGPEAYQQEYLGWPELDPCQVEANRVFRKVLENYGAPKSQYLNLIQKYGKPSPGILAKIENKVGSLGLD